MYANMMYEMYYCWLGNVGLDTGSDTKEFDWTTFDPATSLDEFKEPEKEAGYDYSTYVDGQTDTYPPFEPQWFDLVDWTPANYNPTSFPNDFVAANYDPNDTKTWPVSVEFYAKFYYSLWYAEKPQDDIQKPPYQPWLFVLPDMFNPADYNPVTFPEGFVPADYDATNDTTWPNPIETYDYSSRVEGDSSTY